MTNRSAIVLAFLPIVLLATGRSARANDRDTLKNLRAVDVLIEGLPPEVERDGLTTEELRADVESRLRQSGLQVTTDASEAIYVNLNAHRTTMPDDRYIYNVEVDVNQPVAVLRTNALTLAATWSRATVGITPVSRFPQSAKDDVHDLIDRLLADYMSVNPKP